MRLKKHIDMFVKVVIHIISEQNQHRMYRKDLVDLINKKVNDSRYRINTHQIPRILIKQKKYNVKKIGRQSYEFEKTKKQQ